MHFTYRCLSLNRMLEHSPPWFQQPTLSMGSHTALTPLDAHVGDEKAVAPQRRALYYP